MSHEYVNDRTYCVLWLNNFSVQDKLKLDNRIREIGLPYLHVESFNRFKEWYTEKNEEKLLVILNTESDMVIRLQKHLEDIIILWIHPDSYDQHNILSCKTLEECLKRLELFKVESSHITEKREEIDIQLPENLKLQEDSNIEGSNSPTHHQPVQYEDNPYYIRSKKIQHRVFSQQQWEGHRMVGIWSPLHRTGVTTLTFNFAIFLAKNRIYTAVLEGLTEKHTHKDLLQRYTNKPDHWISYSKAIHFDSHTENTNWTYQNVKFLPLDSDDSKINWNSQSLESYMTTTRIVDITIVDLPTGEMAPHTLHSINFIDEIWMVVDDAYQETKAWKEYIHELKKKTGIPLYMIFNKTYSFSQYKRLSQELEIPLLTTLPSLHEEVMKNYYETVPLYLKENIREHLDPPFIELAKHLLGKDFIPLNQKGRRFSWLPKFLKPLMV